MVNKLFRNPTSNISIQVLRYTLAGGLAYIIDYNSLIILTEIFRIHYLTSAAAAFLLGSIASYILNVKWVFEKRAFNNRYVEISIFVFIGILGLFLNQYYIWLFTENMGLHYLFSKIIATVIVSVANFFMRRHTLFR